MADRDRPNDSSLLQRFNQRETEAIVSVYKLFFTELHLFASKLYQQNDTSPEDVVQDAYISALGHLDSYDGGSFLAWLTTIAKRTALNAVKKNAREIATDLAENEAMFAAGGDPAEGAGLIAAAEKLLPPDDYEIVIMCAVAGYRRREVAKIKGMPVSTVSHRYKSALSKLKKYLEEEERQ